MGDDGGATGEQGGANGAMTQPLPGKVSPGSLKYNITHKQAATETTVIKHTQTHHRRWTRPQAGGREAGVSCISKLWAVFRGQGRSRGHTCSWLLLGKDVLPKWPAFLSINISI